MKLSTLWGLLALPLLALATTAHAQTFTNATPILVPGTGTAAGPGSPYPSNITVSGIAAGQVVSKATVTLTGIAHTFPSDIDILLVSPSGARAIIFSDVGGATAVTGINITLDDAAAATVPSPLVSGTFRPTNIGLTDTFPVPAPTGTTANVALSSFNNTAPNGTWSLYVADDANGDVGQIAGGWSLTLTTAAPAPPSLVLSQRSLNLPAGGPCIFTAGDGFFGTINLTNGGTGNVTVTNAQITGPNASSFTFFSPQPTFPISLNQGATAVPINILFGPLAGATGPQNATLTFTYTLNGGAPQTLTVPLSGSADAEGAGFVFRGSLSDPACSNNAALPGTGFLDIAGHTRIETLSADDVAFNLDLTTAAPSFGALRMFGTDYTSLRVTSNGSVGLGTSPAVATNFYGGARSPLAGLNVIQAAAVDLNMSDATAAGQFGTDYDTSDLGTYTPGVYYGLSDADGDGAADDLVITYYHAYDFGSPNFATATAANPVRYFTAQLVLIQSPRANEEDYAEVRFIDGIEPGSGVAYRSGTDLGGTPIEGLVTAITEGTQTEGAIYRLGGDGGPLYDASGNVAVRFQPEVQARATGQPGWRMLGSPVRNFTVGRLAGVNLVQGVTGQYPSFGNPNVFTYNGSAYTAATNVTNALAPGQGFIWYLFGIDRNPNTSTPPATDGTSQSYVLPMNLEATGAEPSVASGSVMVPLAAGGAFNLVANPFRDDLDVSGLGAWATGGTLTSAVPQVWNPNVGTTGSQTGSYQTVSGSVATWQGFFIQSGTATGLNVPTNARNEAGTFLGRSGQIASQSADVRTLGFQLDGATPDGQPTRDVAATVVFSDDALEAWDLLDASKLAPLNAAYATAAFAGDLDGAAVLKAQTSLPTEGRFVVPVVIDAVGTAPGLTLSWTGLDALPEAWGLELRDIATGTVVDLRMQDAYVFEQTAGAALTLAPEALLARTTTAGQAKAGAAGRFELVVTTGRSTAGETSAITEFALAAPAPNPTSSASVIRYDVPEASRVSVAVYDLLGRRVAVLADGEVAQGRHEARLDARALAPGVYVVRMQAGTFAATQRVTVVR